MSRRSVRAASWLVVAAILAALTPGLAAAQIPTPPPGAPAPAVVPVGQSTDLQCNEQAGYQAYPVDVDTSVQSVTPAYATVTITSAYDEYGRQTSISVLTEDQRRPILFTILRYSAPNGQHGGVYVGTTSTYDSAAPTVYETAHYIPVGISPDHARLDGVTFCATR